MATFAKGLARLEPVRHEAPECEGFEDAEGVRAYERAVRVHWAFTERFTVTPLDGRADGAWQVSGEAGGFYVVDIVDGSSLCDTCTCPHFQWNGLGTCKHIEAVRRAIATEQPSWRAAIAKLGAGPAGPTLSVDASGGLVALGSWTPNLRRAMGLARSGPRGALAFADDVAVAAARLHVDVGQSPGGAFVRVTHAVGPSRERAGRARVLRERRDAIRRAWDDGSLGVNVLKRPPFAYHREGVVHFAAVGRALPADGMGLGKTVQAIAACKVLRARGEARRVVVVTPASFKNFRTKTAAPLRAIPSRFLFVLTGTPVENRLDDLYSLPQLADPAILGPLSRFNLDFHRQVRRGKVVGCKNLGRPRERTAPVVLRRLKEEVLDQLPPLTEQTRYTALTPERVRVESGWRAEAARYMAIAEKRPMSPREQVALQIELLKARQACDALELCGPGAHVRASPKLEEFEPLVSEVAAGGSNKVLVFSGWVCIDEVPIPAETNDMGAFESFFLGLVGEYGRGALYEVVTGDAGFCSEANARLVDREWYGYVFGLKDNQPELRVEAERVLGAESEARAPDAVFAWEREKKQTVQRRLWRSREIAGWMAWTHLRQVRLVRKVAQTKDGGEKVIEDRYFVTNLPVNRLTSAQALELVRRHWAIENDCFRTVDVHWLEDSGLWCRKGNGLLVCSLLSMIAYNIVTLLRSVHGKSASWRSTPWKTVASWIRDYIFLTTQDRSLVPNFV